jgi:hypothetical protein
MSYYSNDYDNPVRPSLVDMPYDWSDSTMVRTALENPVELGAQEVAIAAGVGLVLSLIGERVAPTLVVGTGLYVLGYVAHERGWLKNLTR